MIMSMNCKGIHLLTSYDHNLQSVQFPLFGTVYTAMIDDIRELAGLGYHGVRVGVEWDENEAVK